MKQPAAGSKRIPTGGGPGLTHHPFAALTNEGLSPAVTGGASVPGPCGRPPSSAGNPGPAR
jgi:hypothetical protein